MLTPPPRRTIALWRSCLGSALRTSLACAAVACANLHGPAALRSQLAFPALSYVIAILLVNDMTLGEVLRGAAHAAYGTLQGVVPAILSLWAIGASRLSVNTTTLAVALSGFLVALPESTPVVSKRIAMAQIVLVYAFAFIGGNSKEAVVLPAQVAASTGVGVLASVLALLLPFPRCGYYEVRKKREQLAEIASDELELFVNAFCAENSTSIIST